MSLEKIRINAVWTKQPYSKQLLVGLGPNGSPTPTKTKACIINDEATFDVGTGPGEINSLTIQIVVPNGNGQMVPIESTENYTLSLNVSKDRLYNYEVSTLTNGWTIKPNNKGKGPKGDPPGQATVNVTVGDDGGGAKFKGKPEGPRWIPFPGRKRVPQKA